MPLSMTSQHRSVSSALWTSKLWRSPWPYPEAACFYLQKQRRRDVWLKPSERAVLYFLARLVRETPSLRKIIASCCNTCKISLFSYQCFLPKIPEDEHHWSTRVTTSDNLFRSRDWNWVLLIMVTFKDDAVITIQGIPKEHEVGKSSRAGLQFCWS